MKIELITKPCVLVTAINKKIYTKKIKEHLEPLLLFPLMFPYAIFNTIKTNHPVSEIHWQFCPNLGIPKQI